MKFALAYGLESNSIFPISSLYRPDRIQIDTVASEMTAKGEETKKPTIISGDWRRARGQTFREPFRTKKHSAKRHKVFTRVAAISCE